MRHISSKFPVSELFSLEVLSSFIGHTLIQLGFQAFIFFNLRTRPWYVLIPAEDDEYVISYENTVLFYFCNFVYISLSWILSTGPPFKKHAYTNRISIASTFSSISNSVNFLTSILYDILHCTIGIINVSSYSRLRGRLDCSEIPIGLCGYVISPVSTGHCDCVHSDCLHLGICVH